MSLALHSQGWNPPFSTEQEKSCGREITRATFVAREAPGSGACDGEAVSFAPLLDKQKWNKSK